MRRWYDYPSFSVSLPLFAPRRFTKWKEGNTLHEYSRVSFVSSRIHTFRVYFTISRLDDKHRYMDISVHREIFSNRACPRLFLESRDSDVNAASRIIGPPLNCRYHLARCLSVSNDRSVRLSRRITERCSRRSAKEIGRVEEAFFLEED